MARMAAVGPERFVLPFGAIGFRTAEVGPDDFLDALRGLVQDRAVRLVVCGESLVPEDEEFRELCAEPHTTVLVVPDGPEARGTGLERVRSAVERAAGVDLLSGAEAAASSNA